ncbi:MAG: hypothetical protein J6X18_03360 [Bacteroidales bacterium]|nr:hypothetical protein [Bacteroidales bacterium]
MKKLKDIPEKVKKISAFISAIIVIITACGSLLNWFEAKMTEHLDARISSVENTVNEIRQDTIRLQLDSLINNDSENIESILNVAKVYFIDMNGDWYMTEKFKRWGREHDVDLTDFHFHPQN